MYPNKVAILYSVDLLYCGCYIVLLKLIRRLRAADSFLEACIFVSPGLVSNLHVCAA